MENHKLSKMPEKSRHEQLVDTIRGVHENLRRSCQMGSDPETVWNEHVKARNMRESYAVAMKELATSFWTSPENSRITWCRSVWQWYFHENGISQWSKKLTHLYPSFLIDCDIIEKMQNVSKIKVLDVGSCYNPFQTFAECDCTALDLTPASQCVYECDFLSLRVVDDAPIPEKRGNERRIQELPRESFHVVVFSLLLEYLPSSLQRWRCCALASQLLSPLGLLLIVTPDSKSQHKNAPMMKSWREAIQELGMHRILYKKLPHLHCMAFCKVASREECYSQNFSSACKMYIPQDTNDYTQVNQPKVYEERTEQSDKDIMVQFLELPFSDDF